MSKKSKKSTKLEYYWNAERREREKAESKKKNNFLREKLKLLIQMIQSILRFRRFCLPDIIWKEISFLQKFLLWLFLLYILLFLQLYCYELPLILTKEYFHFSNNLFLFLKVLNQTLYSYKTL